MYSSCCCDDKHENLFGELSKLVMLKSRLVGNPKETINKYIRIEDVVADIFILELQLDKVLEDRTRILTNMSQIKWLELGEKSNKYYASTCKN
jgi:hypothetical protein